MIIIPASRLARTKGEFKGWFGWFLLLLFISCVVGITWCSIYLLQVGTLPVKAITLLLVIPIAVFGWYCLLGSFVLEVKSRLIKRVSVEVET